MLRDAAETQLSAQKGLPTKDKKDEKWQASSLSVSDLLDKSDKEVDGKAPCWWGRGVCVAITVVESKFGKGYCELKFTRQMLKKSKCTLVEGFGTE